MKIGLTITFHYSDNRPSNIKQITQNSIKSFYDNFKYDFNLYLIDNQSLPKDSFSDIIDISTSNLHYTYIEDQFEKGLTGAWNTGIRQAFDDDCDIVILAGDDIIYDDTINKLIEYADSDPLNSNSIYAPVASGIKHPLHQIASAPTGEIYQTPGVEWGQHISPAVLVFTKTFYNDHICENKNLFQVNNKYNHGDGKWGGQEGNLQYWAEQGTRCIVVGTSWVHHTIASADASHDWSTPQGSWRHARVIDRNRNDKSS